MRSLILLKAIKNYTQISVLSTSAEILNKFTHITHTHKVQDILQYQFIIYTFPQYAFDTFFQRNAKILIQECRPLQTPRTGSHSRLHGHKSNTARTRSKPYAIFPDSTEMNEWQAHKKPQSIYNNTKNTKLIY